MLKKIFIKLITSVLSSLLMLFIMFVASISLLTKQFPPDFKAAKENLNNLWNVKENYTVLLNRSKNMIEQQEKLSQNPELEIEPDDPKGNNKLEVSGVNDSLKLEIYQLKVRVTRLEEQNRLLLEKIRK